MKSSAGRMSVVEAHKSGQGTRPRTATYSTSSHCDDENSWCGDTAVSDSSTESMESPRTGSRVDKKLTNANVGGTGPNTERNDTDSCGDGTGPANPAAALCLSTSQANKKSIKEFERALFNMCCTSMESKFMGIAQLNGILKSDTKFAQELRKNKTVMARCWDTIPGPVLDLLLSTVHFKGKEVVERDWVTNHTVFFIHTVVQRLPESSRNDMKFAERIDKLLVIMGLEMYVLSETKTLVLEILDALADTPNGSTALLKSKDWSTLLQSAVVNSITLSIEDKAYRQAFTHKTDLDLLDLQPELHMRISDWATIMRVFQDATPLFEHMYNLVRWHDPEKDISDAPDWLAPLAERLLESLHDRHADALRSQNAVVLLSAALVRCYPEHFTKLLFESQPYVMSGPKSKPAAWTFLQYRLVDIRSSIPVLMDSPADDHDSMVLRLAGCYELVRAFTKFLAESSNEMVWKHMSFAVKPIGSVENGGGSTAFKSGDDGGSDDLPFSPGLLLRMREDISNTCSLTMDYLRDRFEAWEAHKTIHRRGRGSIAATGRFESVHKDSGLPNMAEDPLVLQQLLMLSFWIREDDSDTLKTEAASKMVQVIMGLYGMAEGLRGPLLMLLGSCDWFPNALKDIRGSSGWKAMVADLDSIARSGAPNQQVIEAGIEIIDIIGPLAQSAIIREEDKSGWIEFARIATQLDSAGSAAHLDLKGSTTMLALDLLRLVDPKNLTGANKRLKKKLLAVPSLLMKARGRMNADTIDDLENYLQH